MCAAKRDQRVRAFTVTVNNYTDDNLVRVYELIPELRYQIFGVEVGEKGTPHLQGYIYFDKQRTLRQAAKLMKEYGFKCKLLIALGSPEQNQTYCSKDGQFFECGTFPKTPSKAGGQANAQRWEEARLAAREGRYDDIPADIYIRNDRAFHREFMRYQASQVKTSVPFNFFWIQGDADAGKSSYARWRWPKAYIKSMNKWWEDYKFQPEVIVDDLDHSQAHWVAAFLKRWCDHYTFSGEFKGGAMFIRPEHFCITSQYSIEELWPDDLKLQEALTRRFKVIVLTTAHPWRYNNPDDVSMITEISEQTKLNEWRSKHGIAHRVQIEEECLFCQSKWRMSHGGFIQTMCADCNRVTE